VCIAPARFNTSTDEYSITFTFGGMHGSCLMTLIASAADVHQNVVTATSPGPRLTVTKQASPSPVQDGEQLTYTLCVTNTGDVDLHATITDILPDHVTPTDIPPWTQTIAPGGVWTQQVVVTVTSGYTGALTNVVLVTTEECATGKASVTVCANACETYLPIVLKNYPIDVTGIICRVAVEDKDPYKIWLHQSHIDARFTLLGLTPPFDAKVRPIDLATGAECGNWVSLPVDSFENSDGMRDWEICDVAMKKVIRQNLCPEDTECVCDLDEVVYIEPVEERPHRTLRFVVESER
jgi:uncharacterized repeat protein (TIGR01451 family)